MTSQVGAIAFIVVWLLHVATTHCSSVDATSSSSSAAADVNSEKSIAQTTSDQSRLIFQGPDYTINLIPLVFFMKIILLLAWLLGSFAEEDDTVYTSGIGGTGYGTGYGAAAYDVFSRYDAPRDEVSDDRQAFAAAHSVSGAFSSGYGDQSLGLDHLTDPLKSAKGGDLGLGSIVSGAFSALSKVGRIGMDMVNQYMGLKGSNSDSGGLDIDDEVITVTDIHGNDITDQIVFRDSDKSPQLISRSQQFQYPAYADDRINYYETAASQRRQQEQQLDEYHQQEQYQDAYQQHQQQLLYQGQQDVYPTQTHLGQYQSFPQQGVVQAQQEQAELLANPNPLISAGYSSVTSKPSNSESQHYYGNSGANEAVVYGSYAYASDNDGFGLLPDSDHSHGDGQSYTFYPQATLSFAPAPELQSLVDPGNAIRSEHAFNGNRRSDVEESDYYAPTDNDGGDIIIPVNRVDSIQDILSGQLRDILANRDVAIETMLSSRDPGDSGPATIQKILRERHSESLPKRARLEDLFHLSPTSSSSSSSSDPGQANQVNGGFVPVRVGP